MFPALGDTVVLDIWLDHAVALLWAQKALLANATDRRAAGATSDERSVEEQKNIQGVSRR
jgi:hypothetical protein